METKELEYVLSGIDALIRRGDITPEYARAVRTSLTKMNDADILENGGLWLRHRGVGVFLTYIGKVGIAILDSRTLEIEVPRNPVFANEIYGGIITTCTVDQLIAMVNAAKGKEGRFEHNFTQVLFDHSKRAS